jgi:putative glutamine amidotransferase
LQLVGLSGWPGRFVPDKLPAVRLKWVDMPKRPLILVSPSMESKGAEFGDLSLSLSAPYQQALADYGALPLILSATASRELIADSVSRADGILLTGGEDVEPHLYGDGLPPRLRRTVHVTPDGGVRDLRELILIDEVFRQRKPLLAICRGHQLLNVALGGALIADIRQQVPRALKHSQMSRQSEVVHEARLTRDSLLATITGKQKLGVNSTHHQAIGRVAAPFRAVAVSSDGIVEGLELKPSAAGLLPFLLSVQFHPERLVDRYAEHRAIFRGFTRACALSRDK